MRRPRIDRRYVLRRLLEMRREGISAHTRRRLRDYARLAAFGPVPTIGDETDQALAALGLITLERGALGELEVHIPRAGRGLTEQFRLKFAGVQRPHRLLRDRFIGHLRKNDDGYQRFITARFERWLRAKRVVVCPDLITVSPRGLVTLYEIKRTRADFKRHCKDWNKLAATRRFATQMYFVTLPNVVSKALLPSGWGVIIERPGGAFVTRVVAKRFGGRLTPQDRTMLARAR